ncbi:MAG TPA: lipoyl synthase [Acidobacteriota bacterium]|nr:lipoyl synthase [Acidobacteriota bacterium]
MEDLQAKRARAVRRHPPWLKVKAPFGERVHELKSLLSGLKLNTVCQEAMCPNMGECWSHGVATFMILGDVCTRGCRYCAVSKGKPNELDRAEPRRVAEAARSMGLRHAVITSVDRDDLEDGGAGLFAETIRRIRSLLPECTIEVLTPDFQGRDASIEAVLEAGPAVFNHNIETVPRLFRTARGGGKYDVSLHVLRRVAEFNTGAVVKSGMMLGLGEESDEIRSVMGDLRTCGVRLLTLGQYLRPSQWHLPVARHYHPDEFQYWKEVGRELGFDHVESGPLVRSSYLADRQFASMRRNDASGPDLVQIS